MTHPGTRAMLLSVALMMLAASDAAVRAQDPAGIQQTSPRFGGSYAGLDERRRILVDDWVARFNEATKGKADPAAFYDDRVKLSTKTTFDAVTNALMTTRLTDSSGQQFADALDIIDRVDSVRGQISGTSGDHQFRMYVRLKANAIDMLERSSEFKRGVDNTVYHKGYPINYRQQGGAPSMQVSIAVDRRRADIDVDYRASSFPVALFNGHLSSANSDVRAGNNYDRHANRWAGFQNWWRSIFGIPVLGPAANDKDGPGLFAERPRIGDKTIDLMMEDFLKAWLVDGDIAATMGYISERAFTCLMEDGDDPLTFDRGAAPFLLYSNLKAAHEALGPRTSVDGLTVGVRLSIPGLKPVTHPRHAQYVIYSVPDDIAARFDCESRMSLNPKRTARAYGNYFGATFYVDARGGQDFSIALLWERRNGYWKIVSWQADPEGDDMPETERAPDVKITKAKTDPGLVEAVRTFLESWLIRKDYDQAFGYLSPKSYACYNLVRNQDEPAAASAEEAARKIREGMERAGTQVGKVNSLDELIEGVPPFHSMVRVMDHRYSRTFSLSSLPDAIADAANCEKRAQGNSIPSDVLPVYGNAFGMNVRFRTKSGEAPVMRTLWMKEGDAWRIQIYDVERP